MKLKNNKIGQVASVSAKPPLSQTFSRRETGILSVLVDKEQSAGMAQPEDAVVVQFQYGSNGIHQGCFCQTALWTASGFRAGN
jgi:hypothetical protein